MDLRAWKATPLILHSLSGKQSEGWEFFFFFPPYSVPFFSSPYQGILSFSRFQILSVISDHPCRIIGGSVPPVRNVFADITGQYGATFFHKIFLICANISKIFSSGILQPQQHEVAPPHPWFSPFRFGVGTGVDPTCVFRGRVPRFPLGSFWELGGLLELQYSTNIIKKVQFWIIRFPLGSGRWAHHEVVAPPHSSEDNWVSRFFPYLYF